MAISHTTWKVFLQCLYICDAYTLSLSSENQRCKCLVCQLPDWPGMAFRSLTGAACCKNKVPGWKLKYVNVKKKQIYNELNSVASKQCFLLGSVWWAVGLPGWELNDNWQLTRLCVTAQRRAGFFGATKGQVWQRSRQLFTAKPRCWLDAMLVPHRWPPVAWAPGTSLACKVRCLPDFLSQPIFGCLNFSGRGGKTWKLETYKGERIGCIKVYFDIFWV